MEWMVGGGAGLRQKKEAKIIEQTETKFFSGYLQMRKLNRVVTLRCSRVEFPNFFMEM